MQYKHWARLHGKRLPEELFENRAMGRRLYEMTLRAARQDGPSWGNYDGPLRTHMGEIAPAKTPKIAPKPTCCWCKNQSANQRIANKWYCPPCARDQREG